MARGDRDHDTQGSCDLQSLGERFLGGIDQAGCDLPGKLVARVDRRAERVLCGLGRFWWSTRWEGIFDLAAVYGRADGAECGDAESTAELGARL
jgi:hypothetical protein